LARVARTYSDEYGVDLNVWKAQADGSFVNAADDKVSYWGGAERGFISAEQYEMEQQAEEQLADDGVPDPLIETDLGLGADGGLSGQGGDGAAGGE
jgi:hypothetical protein